MIGDQSMPVAEGRFGPEQYRISRRGLHGSDLGSDARMRDTGRHGQIMTKTVRSRFNHEVGESVEGCKILEKSIIAPPDLIERRRGIYDYLVEVPPEIVKSRTSTSREAGREAAREAAPARDSYTR